MTDGGRPDPILDAVASQVDGLVTSYVVVASYMSPTGQPILFTDVMNGQTVHCSLGLLDFAQTVERREALNRWNAGH